MPPKKKGVFISKGKSGPDPWCLVCGVNLRLDGRSFVALTNDDAAETRRLFVKVLGTQFKSDYASVNLCGKCERALQRINRYAGLESAKKEALNLKKSLAENLKRKKEEPNASTASGNKDKNNVKASDNSKSDPLIEEEAEETWSDNQQLVQDDQEGEEEEEETVKAGPGEEDQENLDTDKMPLGLFKKKDKKDKKEKKDKKKDKNEAKTELVEPQEDAKPVGAPDQDQNSQPVQFKEGTTLAAMASTVPKKPAPVREWEHEFDSPDGGTVPNPSNDTSQSAVKEKTDPEKPVDKDETELKKLEAKEGGVKDGAVKSENSPLIHKDGEGKESKLQDQQPGMLCCTIL